MAYDESGNYYFNPHVDEYDRELVEDEVKRKQARDYVDAHAQQANQQKDFNDLWNEVLSDEGMDQQTYNEMFAADPVSAKTHFKAAMKHVAGNIKRGVKARDPRTGQFTKETGQSDRRQLEAAHHAADPEKLAQLKETAKSRSLTEAESEEAIDALIGKLF